jgi:hypothetical protein
MSQLTQENPLAKGFEDFEPRQKPTATAASSVAPSPNKVLVRQSAKDAGFTQDNTTTIVRARRTAGKQAKSHTMRLYIDDINAFQIWCNDNNYTQAEGFEKMVAAGIRLS